MTTPFKLLLAICGLSHREAAAFLKMSVRSVENFGAGRSVPRPTIMEELRDLYDAQREAADQALDEIDRHAHAELVLVRPADDHEAQSAGWPCVGAWDGMAAMIVAETASPVRIVPLGSEPATALAADLRQEADRDASG